MKPKFVAVKIVTGEPAANKALKDGWIYLSAVGIANNVNFIFGIPEPKQPEVGGILAAYGTTETPPLSKSPNS